jgi:serine/threonine protein kinase
MEMLIANRYELEQLLGSGAMSEVWCATDRKLERRVALKLLAPQADTTRFEREAHAVASLAHPNITQLYDYGEDGGRPYMVLEFLGGGTLADRLEPGRPLRDAETRAFALDIAAGLGHAHSRGIVHRDLKPANVLFDDEGRAKIADFGIARFAVGAGTVTEAGTLIGTAAYMSPEQAGGEPAGPASDVYSFGVMLYQMLTGRLPFEADNPLELVALHRTAAPQPLSLHRTDTPAELEATVTAALAKDPAERPADGRALLIALGAAEDTGLAAAAALPAPETTLTLQQPPAQPPPRRRARVPLAAAALLVLALAGVGLAYTVSRPANSSPAPATQPRQSQTKPQEPDGGTSTLASTVPSSRSTAEQTTTGATTRKATTRATTSQATTEARAATTTGRTTTARTTTELTTTARTTETTATTTTATTTAGTTTEPATTAPTTTSATTTTATTPIGP